MKYTDLSIQTQREAPNNARTQGFAFLVRGSYLTRENRPTPLGEYALKHLEELSTELGDAFISKLDILTIGNEEETFFALDTGTFDVIHCPNCGYTARSEFARFAKSVASKEEALPIEKVETPHCNTIEDLANFLEIPKEQTAKALLFTRQSDGKLVFAVVRGDMQLSEAKLQAQVGEIKMADYYAMEEAGAVPGYAAPIDLKDTLIIVDDLIPDSPNLVTGANDEGYHLKNVNYGRDYSAEIVTDLVQANEGDTCVNCGEPLSELSADLLKSKDGYDFDRILHALAETHHDDNGLSLPHPAAPFDVYLMNIPGKTMDTGAVATELSEKLDEAGISVFFDDRDTRAGVKFNDADLIGPPVRVTIGERGLQNGNVEMKPRTASQNGLVSLTSLTGLTSQAEFWNLVDNLDL
ncbi:MAG: YbaK/EbsC family protein [Anaerolineales bacterium]|jgi:prolyl-tRNA synthetase